ncbi:Dyp-type peroxidase [Roseateles koreensis]|uniref:Dyp-type peroxidase n=1 Tax=Roseateles koreensis TaxID=2987526 RepID=A0ABT5KRZ3_9BURK|nr:Dyp-type peroxidase domain-containing protein [Roseateles koreensis]MDC8785688.1 Dyp-type peroxidase [Roseateles koreensis]
MAPTPAETQLQGITDLVLITPVKAGFVTAFETITYVDRLRRVLKSLNALRLGSRESSDAPGLFTDVVSHFRIVHSFRWALIEPGADAAPGTPTKLLLNVCFDGGWEPYMRVIWNQLGSMLDLILCHAVDYRLASETSFERYQAWVRAHEIASDFLYFESGRSAADHELLAALEWQQRQHAPPADLDATRLRLPQLDEPTPLPGSPAAQLAMGVRALPALATLYTLDRYFSATAPDGHCLLRAAQDILFELHGLNTATLFPTGSPLRAAYYPMLDWFEKPVPKTTLSARALPYSDADIQGGMITAYPDLGGGALVLLRVTQPALAVAWLSAFQATTEADVLAERKPADGLYRNVALSLAGLKALGVSPQRLERMPQPFKEGMEARAGVLGDLRHNHPRYWKLPPRNWPPTPEGGSADPRRVDLGSMHVLIQLRHNTEFRANTLHKAINELERGSGLQVLSVQTMRRNARPHHPRQTVENFGFVDGISQPSVGTPSAPTAEAPYADVVNRGELLLGFRTDRDSCAVPEEADALLDKGTFLVVRKLRQYVGRLNQTLEDQAATLNLPKESLLAKMMGRWPDGRPLAAPEIGAANTFSYADDKQGAKCPFHAHIRRANPRTDPIKAPAVPRLLRRGMSYGPAYQQGGQEDTQDEADRGLVFMAYNANLAEQFETVQRWIAGGNSSGGYAGQSDPFLGVAVPKTPATDRLPGAAPRVFRFEHEGKPIHLNLGDQPFVELQWGAYFFVPAMTALRQLPAWVELPTFPASIATPMAAPDLDNFAAWQQWLEDPATHDAAWAYVRSQPGGVLRTAYGVLVGEAARVCEVFRDPDARYSVSGYGERMAASIGRGYLGMDEDTGHREQAPLINAAIEAIDEGTAFTLARSVANTVVGHVLAGARQLQLKEALLDMEQLSEQVLAALCTTWFGLPDGLHMWGMEWHAAGLAKAPRCPQGFLAVSRFVFGPHPNDVVQQVAPQTGQALFAAVRQWLANQPAGAPLPVLSEAIRAALHGMSGADADIVPRTIAGIMLGFPPTVHGNTLSTLGAWVVSRKLWDFQQAWPHHSPDAAAAQVHQQAVAVLRPALIATMVGRPVPGAVWRKVRKPHSLGPLALDTGDTVIVGIGSATQQSPGEHYPMFGGDRHDPVKPAPLHACPGYAMAIGVMMGVIAGVLEAGTLRYTGSPTVLAVQT